MSFLDLAKSRYATKKYDATRKIGEEKIEELKEIIRLSPSSINSQPWKFTFVTNEAVKKELAAQSYMNEQSINDVNLLVVFSVMEDIEYFEKRNISILPEAWRKLFYEPMIKSNGDVATKSWMEHQVYLSLGYFLSACISMGLDATPMEGINIEAYKQILSQDGYTPLFSVSVGYADLSDWAHPSVLPKSRFELEEVVQSI
ncbi:nitroreductase family protein [Flavobacterium hibernum]|uniref:NAD(P)H-dependent oxidoreductase n=1 Tax=Flavobacterium hibernum TaxID=37752 RepID=A0A0D0EZH5_9FLAO|nr:nitroreductase family protein [Flavobacterium hibernum]KIO52776.1 nitroreductase [Flavobacterium hibernum]OXA83942.1 NAD(P)H-dependent oxidoreductase [Flavobacterium hibernum]STO15465.1 Oxygen-insensitive NAD(P)H nitroreductase [Flavobacterium hibernum]